MGELESIRDNTANATRDVQLWCQDFERSFEFVCAIYESLLHDYENGPNKDTLKYIIVPSIDRHDYAMVLNCKPDGKPNVWKQQEEDTFKMYQCSKTNCSVHRKSKENNEFHVYHLDEHPSTKDLRMLARTESIRQIQEGIAIDENKTQETGKGSKKANAAALAAKQRAELLLQQKRAELLQQRNDLIERVQKMEVMVNDSSSALAALEEQAKEILDVVMHGGGPEKTMEYAEKQTAVQVKSEEHKVVAQELEECQAELDEFDQLQSETNVPSMHSDSKTVNYHVTKM